MTEEISTDLSEYRSEQRKLWLTRLAIAIAVVAVAMGIWYFITQRGRVNTDNAYVGAESAQITPLIAAPVKEVRFSNTQFVRKGDVLVVLDDTDAQVDVATARAALLQAQQKFGQARASGGALDAKLDAQRAQIQQAQAKLGAVQADFDKARDALARREALSSSGAVSAEEVSQARAEFADRQSALQQARAAITAAKASRASARGDLAVNEVITRTTSIDGNPDVAAALARLQSAQVNLSRTIIRAPVSGIVTQRQVQIGQRVTPGAPIMVIVPTDRVFVDANFKESQLRKVRPGQPVTLTSDYYGSDVEYTGRVMGIAGGTGSAFAIIPAQNATGNWVKVVQRLPVRIKLDPAQLQEHPLRVGLSMYVTVDTRSQ
jgi:membrane fusion protein, multidrug efflux system